jgi:hypothetical protein
MPARTHAADRHHDAPGAASARRRSIVSTRTAKSSGALKKFIGDNDCETVRMNRTACIAFPHDARPAALMQQRGVAARLRGGYARCAPLSHRQTGR